MSKKTIDERLQELQTDVKKILQILDPKGKVSSQATLSNDEPTMSIKEVANFLRLDESIILEKCRSREIPTIKQGKLTRIKKMDMINWIRKRKGAEPGSIDDYVNRYLDNHPLRG